MAKRSPSVLKRQRQEKRRTVKNRMVKSRIKTLVKKAKQAAIDNDENSEQYLKAAIKAIDKAAAKGILHKNTASRKKSRLMQFVKKYKTDLKESQEKK